MAFELKVPEGFYSLEDDNLTIRNLAGKKYPAKPVGRMSHNSTYTYPVRSTVFNRGVRHHETILITGDYPRIAMLTTHPEDRTNPHFMKLGELRIRVKSKELDCFLDEADTIQVRFHPVSTEWIIEFDKLSVKFHLRVSLFGRCGICGTLNFDGDKGIDDLKAELVYGGFQIGERTFQPEWFLEGKSPVESTVEQADSASSFFIRSAQTNAADADEASPRQYVDEIVKLNYIAENGSAFINDDKAVCEIKAAENGTVGFCVSHRRNETGNADAEHPRSIDALEEQMFISDNRCDRLLNSCHCETPSAVLTAGFRHAVLNLDYIHIGKAWYEGGHWWNCYWTNNNQISSAISLGQYEFAREALLFFGTQPEGYSTITAAGRLAWKETYEHAGRQLLGFEGVPYYIYQLWQYVEETGDLTIIAEVLDHIKAMVDDMFTAHDPYGQGLPGWRLGCNSFLYQADHLGMPGSAASPSIMMCGMLEKLAYLAGLVGRDSLSEELNRKSEEMRKKLIPVLWRKKQGYFAGYVDFEGKSHDTHYYTDLVFPALYLSLSPTCVWHSLDHLRDSLLVESTETGGLMMKVGDLKPDIFGNNNIMPTQMAESARAFALTGDKETAVRLMESVALSATVYTESPGSYPERMNNEGKGEFNYMFGNPCASFVYSFIVALFGLQRTNLGRKLEWSPGFPDEWDNASLDLPYATVAVSGGKDKRYSIELLSDDIESIAFSVVTKPLASAAVYVNGEAVPAVLEPVPCGTRITFEIPADCRSYEIRPVPVYKEMDSVQPFTVCEGEAVVLPDDLNAINDTLGVTEGTAVPGKYNVYALQSDANTIVRIPVTVKEKAGRPKIRLVYADSGDYRITVDGEAFGSRGRQISVSVSLYLKNGKKTLDKANVPVGGDGSFFAELEIGDRSEEIKGKVYAEYRLFDKDGQSVLFYEAKDLEPDRLPTGRELLWEPFDLKKYLSDDVMMVRSAWREGRKYHVYFNSLEESTNVLKTGAGDFRVQKTEKEPNAVRLCVIGPGFSHTDSRLPVPSGKPSGIVFYVGKRIYCLKLLYASELESRLTNDTVGFIRLVYDTGEDRVIELTSGKNVSSLFGHYAEDVYMVKIDNRHKTDGGSVLDIACDPSRTLLSFEIRMNSIDSELALIAANTAPV